MYILPGRYAVAVRVRNEIESDFKLDPEGGVDEGSKAGVGSTGEANSTLKADIDGKPGGNGEAGSAGDKDVDAKADADSKVNSDHNGDPDSDPKTDPRIHAEPNVKTDPNINTNSTITAHPDPDAKDSSIPTEDTRHNSNAPSNPHLTRPYSHQPIPSSRTTYKTYTQGTKTLTIGIITYNNGSQTTYTPPPIMDILGVDINTERSPMGNMFIMSPLLFLGIVVGCVLMMTAVRGVWGRGEK